MDVQRDASLIVEIVEHVAHGSARANKAATRPRRWLPRGSQLRLTFANALHAAFDTAGRSHCALLLGRPG